MKTALMDPQVHNYSSMGAMTSLLSIGSASFSLITIKDVQPYITLVASLVAITSGIFAIRYYRTATNKIKNK